MAFKIKHRGSFGIFIPKEPLTRVDAKSHLLDFGIVISARMSLCAPNIGHFVYPLSFFDLLCYLESFFHVEEEESGHVNPRVAGYCLERVLDEISVARFVVPGVEAVLKDACLDVVAFLAFLPRDGIHLPSDFAAFVCFVVKITVGFLSILIRDRYLPFALLHLGCIQDFCRVLVRDFQCAILTSVKVKTGWLALYAVGYKLESVLPVGNQPAIVRALVCAIGMQLVNLVAGHLPDISNGLLTKPLSAALAGFTCTSVIRFGLPPSSQVSVILAE